MGEVDRLESQFRKHYSYLKDRRVQYDYKRRKAARIVQILEETGGLRSPVLEIGVGSGGIAGGVSRCGVRVVGTDIAPEAIQRAREHCANDDVSLLLGSGFRLPFRDGSFPLAYASQVLHLFDSDARAVVLREVHRVLKAGGRFVFDLKNVWSHPVAYYWRSAEKRRRNYPSEDEIRSLLQGCGYGNVETLPGLLPWVQWSRPANIAPWRALSHTRFYVAHCG